MSRTCSRSAASTPPTLSDVVFLALLPVMALVVALPEPNLDAVHRHVDPLDQQSEDPRLLDR